MKAQERKLLIYQEALNQLRQHPSLIWTRNNFFLLVQSGLLAVVLQSESKFGVPNSILIGLVGTFIAIIWIWVIHAGQMLQRQWRKLVVKFEADLFGESGGTFVQASRDIGEGRKLAISITTALKVLAFGFLVVWLYLLAYFIVLYFSSDSI